MCCIRQGNKVNRFVSSPIKYTPNRPCPIRLITSIILLMYFLISSTTEGSCSLLFLSGGDGQRTPEIWAISSVQSMRVVTIHCLLDTIRGLCPRSSIEGLSLHCHQRGLSSWYHLSTVQVISPSCQKSGSALVLAHAGPVFALLVTTRIT